ncbi:MAG: molybdenum cofactor biosynthesis protein MoaE [Anaerolineaceae bacterium]|nr:molybdenum cofactor biosynthesis protein MoaE [Anaerolineaceae bacterium]
MKIKVRLFATFKEVLNEDYLVVELFENAQIKDLKHVIQETYPEFKSLIPRAIFAVNQVYADDQTMIVENIEIAMFPPVSGGSKDTIIQVTEEPVILDDLITQLTTKTTGAVNIFTGVVRGLTTQGYQFITESLEYEAYKPMAETKMLQIADEIRENWQTIEGIAIIQRLGHLDAGQPSTYIICTASHRNTGVFAATEYAINRLKEIVPVWKKEISPGGEEWIEGDYFPEKGE